MVEISRSTVQHEILTARLVSRQPSLTWSPGPAGEYPPKSENHSSFILLYNLFNRVILFNP